MNKYIIGAIIAICLFVGGLLIGKLYLSKTDIQVVDRVVYKTVWKDKPAPDMPFTQDNFNNLLHCAVSDINFKDRTEKNYLYVTAYDECKEATARYEIGAKGDWIFYGELFLGGAVLGGLTYLILMR